MMLAFISFVFYGTMIPEHILNRKGPRSIKDLDPEVLKYLNTGLVETKNLMEWLATDQEQLLKLVLKEIGKAKWINDFKTQLSQQKKPTANSNVKIIGQVFSELTKSKSVYKKLRNHKSDVVRCWACWAESEQHDNVSSLLTAMKPYAADTHFGVREVVIFASKDAFIESLTVALKELKPWVKSKDENVRRYAIEAMRPVGVWTKKIPQFQEKPEKAIGLLNPLKSDDSKYVRDSVGNWLNDASKSQPAWVESVCSKWTKQSSSKETAYIVKRGLRTINK